MSKLAFASDAIPLVETTAARDVRFPTPDTNQRVLNLETGAFELYNGSVWTTIVTASIVYTGSATYNPGNLVDGAGETTTVTVTGAALGDYASCSFSNDLQGITTTAWVSAADTVSVRFQNETGGAVNLASGTLRARVLAA